MSFIDTPSILFFLHQNPEEMSFLNICWKHSQSTRVDLEAGEDGAAGGNVNYILPRTSDKLFCNGMDRMD